MSLQKRALDALNHYQIHGPVVVTATGTTTPVDLANIDGDALFLFSAAASAASTSITAVLQSGLLADGSDAVDVPGFVPVVFDAVASAVAAAVPRDELGRYFRISFEDEVGAYSAAVNCIAVGTSRYMS